MITPLLSIMLPTTVDRRKCFYPLLESVLKQVIDLGMQEFVEILIDEDAKQKSIGLKRQHLLERTTGIFVVGIDSDDQIANTYIDDILNAINSKPNTDHIGFIESCSIDGEISKSIFSIRHKQWAENTDGYDHIRCANPKSVIRRTKALQVGFKDSRFGEDRIFSEAVTPLLESEVFIDKPLYYYNYISSPHNERYGLDRE
jgi:hypothetical protein